MVSRTKKAVAAKASDTITFKKSELIKKLKYFLENENACDGDWLHKVKTQFLGQKSSDIVVTLSVPATICLNMCFDEDLRTKAAVEEELNRICHEGEFDLDYGNGSEYEVIKIEKCS